VFSKARGIIALDNRHHRVGGLLVWAMESKTATHVHTALYPCKSKDKT